MYRQTRSISFKSLGGIFGQSSSKVATGTGNGAVEATAGAGVGSGVESTDTSSNEPVRFEVLGATANMLNVRLPKSAVLNVRYNNLYQRLVAVNGSVEKLYIELAKKQASGASPLLFQRCFNKAGPMSLLFALKAQNSNYSVVETGPSNQPWMVKRDSLVAWTGNYLNVATTSKLSRLAQITGEGKFAIASAGQISQIDLADGESILVSPRSVVAYTTDKSTIEEAGTELNSGARNLVDLSIPKVSLFESVGYYYNATKKKVSQGVEYLRERAEKQRKATLEAQKKAEAKQASLAASAQEKIDAGVEKIKEKESESVKEMVQTVTESKESIKDAAASVTQPIKETVAKVDNKVEANQHAAATRASVATNKTTDALRALWQKITTKLSLWYAKLASGANQSYMLEFKGPKTILVNNAINLKTDALTRQEIDALKL